MLESFLVVAKQVFILFVLMGVGVFCRRMHILSRQAVKGLTELLVLIVTPALIVHAFQRPFEPALLTNLGWAFASAVGVHAAASLAAFLFVRDKADARRGVLRFAVIFSNAGFMGIPLEQALLGPRGVFFGALYVVVFNLACWSWGVVVMRGNWGGTSLKSFLLNPGTVGVLLGLPFFCFSLKLPSALFAPLEMIAQLNTPLAMIMTGWYLAQADLRPVWACAGAYVTGLFRLAVMPLGTIAVFAFLRKAGLRLDAVMCAAIVIAAAAPVAALTTVVAARCNRDVSLATGLVSATTLLSLATMPPVVGLAMWLFGC